MKQYQTELQKRQLAATTIDRYCKNVTQFLDWWTSFPHEAQTKDILNYIQYLQGQQVSPNRINQHLNSLRQYYSLVVQTHNPVGLIYLKHQRPNVLENVLPYHELELLYQAYPIEGSSDYLGKRDRIILGLLVYQGVTNQDLHQLQLKDIDLTAGQIYLRSNRRSNARTLELKAHQFSMLQEYIYHGRKRLYALIHKEQAGRKTLMIDPKIKEQLFFSRTGSIHIKNTLKHLFIRLEKLHPKIMNAKQIRASVLAHWLKEKDVREVQYMAGHRYVSSTEQYDLYRYEALKHSLQQFHPLADD
ncbi:MAG: phage integrase N-terminal SAM-like domain-containing protein [Bacteroidota bacterium]